jgi:hypothetical protein
MPICNRDKDASEQKEVIKINVGAMATGVTREAWVAPWPCTVEAIYAFAATISGAPTILAKVNRFIVGTGATSITGMAPAYAVKNYTTSGLASLSLAASGSTLLALNAKDCVEITSAGSNAAFADLIVMFQVKKTQDILSHF